MYSPSAPSFITCVLGAEFCSFANCFVIFPDIAAALIGYAEQFGQETQAVYDKEKVIKNI